MSSKFNIENYRSLSSKPRSRFEKRISALQDNGIFTEHITTTVDKAIENIDTHKCRSFVIYGEPQSGKTEMMIALTARLLDEGHQMVIVLMNDSVQLLEQNLERFVRSGLDPSPKRFNEILDPDVKLAGSNWVVFCKKNASDLTKLIDKVDAISEKVVIDDEADFATPNSKINQAEKTRINELVGKLLSDDGIYIGVTATPARLDVNNTFDNDNGRWVDFKPHPLYTGQDIFFPTTHEGCELEFTLELLPDEGDDPKYLRNALLSFFVNVAYLNLEVNTEPQNYCMLIHTSGKKVDHSKDYEQVVRILSALRDHDSKNFEPYVRSIYERAAHLYPEREDEITRYVVDRAGQSGVIVMNSNAEKNATSYRQATSPAALFTIAIGGNIVSRGVTFDNLLGMFFTRDVKHKLQQDTYIQRARMFGNRGRYLRHFELHIPESLYFDWQKCFVFHKLALSSIRAGMGSPVWVEGERVQITSSQSIDKARVVLASGEMSWDMFSYAEKIDEIVGDSTDSMRKLESLFDVLGDDAFPAHVIDFVRNFSFDGSDSVAVHPTTLLSDSYKSGGADPKSITRPKGFMATHDLEHEKYPRAIHHIKIYKNNEGNARVFYKYTPEVGRVRFIKKLKPGSTE